MNSFAPRLLAALSMTTLLVAPAPAQSDDPISILPLGDSITQVTEGRSYRSYLWHMLLDAGYVNIDFVGSRDFYFGGVAPLEAFDADHEGHWGWTTDEVYSGLRDWIELYEVDVALVHLGTNDTFQNQNSDQTFNELAAVIGRLRNKNPNVIILMAQIIPYRIPGVDPDDPGANDNPAIDELNAKIAGLASFSTPQSPVVIVDHNTGFDLSLMTTDGAHPNELGAQVMADRWFAALTPLIPDARVPGDLNCDGVLDTFDIDPFIAALAGADAYTSAAPGCDRQLADLNGDGEIDTFDIDAFLAAIGA